VRLFVALEIPAAVRDNLAIFLNDMRKLADQLAEKGVKWVRPENLHVTLKFVGEVPDAKLEGICSALSTVHAEAPIALRLRGLGFFPDEKRPTVLWTGLDASINLPHLADDIECALVTCGIAKEKRAFTPHLTLARLTPPGMHPKMLNVIRENSDRDFGSLQAREFHLIQSELKSAGAEYTSLATFPIGPEA
jgi:2'-5' RNA ligase